MGAWVLYVLIAVFAMWQAQPTGPFGIPGWFGVMVVMIAFPTAYYFLEQWRTARRSKSLLS